MIPGEAIPAQTRDKKTLKMCATRKLLLAVFIFTVLSYKGTAEGIIALDLAPGAVDDLYNGCQKEAMEKFIKSGLLTQELDRDEGFKKAWSENSQCSKLISGGTKEHTTALSAMANGDSSFKKTFNAAVKTMGVNVSTYENSFHFKSLHFLLMDSMKLVQNQCRTVYLLTDRIYVAKVGLKVRFGGFTTVFKSYSEIKDFEQWHGQFIFNITSCFSVDLDDTVCSQDSNKVLLSPAEAFIVKDVTEVNDKLNEDQYTEIVLENPKLDSSHNCYISSRSPADVSAQWLVFVFVALTPLFLA